MGQQTQQFFSKEFGALDILLLDSKPYFPATECARILGYSNAKDAIIRHCKGVVKHDSHTRGGVQSKNYIPEGDLYRLIIRSKLPAAERFEHWVFDELLPIVRQYGAYVTRQALEHMTQDRDYADNLLSELTHEYEKNDALLDKVEELTPKAKYCDDVLNAENAVSVSIIAKDYGMSAGVFNRLLNGLGIQYKVSGTWVLYHKHDGKGYTKSRTHYVSDTMCSVHTYWTQKGRRFLYNTLGWYGIYPLSEQFERCGCTGGTTPKGWSFSNAAGVL